MWSCEMDLKKIYLHEIEDDWLDSHLPIFYRNFRVLTFVVKSNADISKSISATH